MERSASIVEKSPSILQMTAAQYLQCKCNEEANNNNNNERTQERDLQWHRRQQPASSDHIAPPPTTNHHRATAIGQQPERAHAMNNNMQYSAHCY
jgi:hypothetical protein